MNNFLIVVSCLAMIVGVLILFRLMRAQKHASDLEGLAYAYKDDLPILPRSQRQFDLITVPDTTSEDNQVETTENAIDQTEANSSILQAKTISLESEVQPSDQNLPTNNAYAAMQSTSKSSTKLNEFSQNSPIIDKYLDQTRHLDQNNDPLLNVKDVIMIYITPRSQMGVSGREVLDIVRKYEMRYGVKSLYHRYEHQDGNGNLWFSMLGATYDGHFGGFDLNMLVDSHFSGLALFLSLPNPHALRGLNSMISTARIIAKDLDADLHDKDKYILSDNDFQEMTLVVKNYAAA